MLKKNYQVSQTGFTLIEMIVSLAVFLVVITISVGALLMLIGTNEQLQAEQSVMTNLSFALDSMTREIRTGSHYYCDSDASSGGSNIFGGDQDVLLLNNDGSQKTNDCSGGTNASHRFQGISFVEGGNSITGNDNRILYYFDKTEKRLYRKIGDGTAQPITSSSINIEKAEFYVSGSVPLSVNSPNKEDQALVTIFIEASDAGDVLPNPKLYRLQTTITQRALDI